MAVLKRGAGTLRAAFGFAFAGIGYAWRTQRNLRIHVAVAAVVVVAGLFAHLDRAAWLAIILAIGLVLVAELLNTAVEALVDLVSPARHPLAKAAKDAAAGAVLLAAATAVAVGLVAFGSALGRVL